MARAGRLKNLSFGIWKSFMTKQPSLWATNGENMSKFKRSTRQMKREPKISVSEFRTQATAMVADGTMPTIDLLLEVVAGIRAKYVPLIKAARQGARREG
jgi:hypothetical protein